MLAFIIRRLLQAIVVMLTVALIAFTLFRFVGDPVNRWSGMDDLAEERARLRQELGLNDPIPVQFARFVGNAARLDFGNSYQFKTAGDRPDRRPFSRHAGACASPPRCSRC